LTQSIRKSGNADMRLFLILRILPKSKFLSAVISIETSKFGSSHDPLQSPIPISGPADILVGILPAAILALISGSTELSPPTYWSIFDRSSLLRKEFKELTPRQEFALI
jgi:hypothetical protein